MATVHLTPARDHCLAPSRASGVPETYAGKYRRLFPELEPLECERDFLFALGGKGGACDGSQESGDDAHGAAGWPFFGQFVAHDITADRSPLALHADPDAVANFRTPRANLECVYGDGPGGSPFLYDREDPAKLLLGEGGRDLPRNAQGVALVGDPRNDVHIVVSQLHLAFLKVHNGLVDRLREDGVAEGELLEEARRATTWHYQWLILEDFLPQVVGRGSLAEPRVYRPDGAAYIPFEFADGAYRYGHSQIRHAYRLNDATEPLPLFPDLVGFRPVPPERTIDWSWFFDLPGRPARQQAKRIDGRLPASLIELPVAITGEVELEQYHSLAARDLVRGEAVGLPSGEVIARALAVEPLTPEETGTRELGWEHETPLWYYVLKEAEAREDGERLGPVGARIVGEVLAGIVDADPESYRSVDPGWRPTLPSADGEFRIGELLAFAA